jgi:hypothetical protein
LALQNGGATTMDDQDPSNNGGATIVVISFSIIKRVHICGLPSSMILQKKIFWLTKIRIDKNYIQYIQRQNQES